MFHLYIQAPENGVAELYCNVHMEKFTTDVLLDTGAATSQAFISFDFASILAAYPIHLYLTLYGNNNVISGGNVKRFMSFYMGVV